LVLPTSALAEEIAAEWAAQGEELAPASMPMMRMACAAIDLLSDQREREILEMATYGETEMLCYRAERPAELIARQEAIWQPLLDWAAQDLDAPLVSTAGIVHSGQPEASLQALRRRIESFDNMALAALSVAVRSSGSLIIGLALHAGRLDSEVAYEAAELDASYQIALWGEDAEASRRRAGVKADIAAAERFFRALER
jgi:chaperone required for assembly of F1-ATPase